MFAQTEDPFSIRVESDLVLVHAEVYNDHSLNSPTFRQCRIASAKTFDNLPFSEQFIPSDCYHDVVIHDLGVNDFHVFEDGIEQKLESVQYEPEALISARDNHGFHAEWSHTPRGKWSTIDLGTQWLVAPGLHFYRLAYVPSRPVEGKCHKIKVSVDRRAASVYSTDQYCYTTNPASDPLQSTKLGRRMQNDLDSDRKPAIPLSMAVNYFYTDPHTVRVDIVVEFPWDHLAHHFARTDLLATIGVLGVAYKKDGSVAARFSDFGCCASGTRWFANAIVASGNLPSRYETQMDLPTGDAYQLNVVLSDGDAFGRAVIPLDISANDGNQLSISSVVLSNRFRDAKVAAEEGKAVNLAPYYVPMVSKDLQYVPEAGHSFKSSDHLTAYFEVYEPLLAEQPNTSVQALVRIVDNQTGDTRFDFHAIDAVSYRREGTTVFAIAGDLPVAQLAKGSYRVEVQAADSVGRKTPVRITNFTIE
jgi:hypothetical protein